MSNSILILFLVLILVAIILFTTKENFQSVSKPREKCLYPINASLYPKNENQVYESSMLYKYYKNGLNSNMFNVNYSHEDIILNPKLKNLPLEEENIGAVNEGTSQLKFCKPCENVKSEDACKKNLRITGDDYCPNLSKCTTAEIMPNSITLKHPKNLHDKEKYTYLKQLEILGNMRQGYNNIQQEKCNSFKKKLEDFPEMKTKFSIFHNIYGGLLNYSYKIDKVNDDIDFSDINNFNVKRLSDFLNDPKNIFFFDLKSNISIKVINNDGSHDDYPTIKKAQESLEVNDNEIYEAIKNFENVVQLQDKKILAGRNNLDTNDYLKESLEIMNEFSKNIQFCNKFK